MKINRHLSSRIAAITGLALVTSVRVVLAVPDLSLGTFDTGLGNWNGPYMWGKGWGSSTVAWDAAEDNTGNGGGSVYISGPFDRATSDTPIMCYGLNGGNPWAHSTPAFDMSVYKSLEFDIKWNSDPANMSIASFNSQAGGGTQGLEIHACPDGAGGPVLTNLPIPAAAASGWTHVVIPINPAMSGLGAVYGVWFNKWLASTAATGTFGIWLDNVVLKGSDAPLPPPTMTLAKAVPGLAFVAASSGQYDRQEIRTVGSNYSWIGASGPVSYSVNVAKLADNAHPGFVAFMHLVPGIPNPTRADSDWHETNVVLWRINNNADGSAWSDLTFKTNAPDDNGHLYDTGNLGGVGSGTALGTWTITFGQDTNFTITTPTGGTHTTNFPPEVVALFKQTPNMQINVGCVPGNPSRIGQMYVVNGVKITGTPGEPNLDSNFLGHSLETNIWTIIASANGVQEIPLDAPFWLDWTLPAQGFNPETTATLTGGSWASQTNTSYEAGGQQHLLVRQSDLPSSRAGFFRLMKRVPVKLQVLLPGETNAPGTVTGKIGTPIAQAAYVPFNITVNMVDSTWHILSSTDTVTLTSTDPVFEPSVITDPPRTVPLVNGTVTIEAYLGTAGQQTITATDVTDATKLPNTSARVTVQ